MLSHILLLVTSWTVVHQAPLSMEFSQWEYWSGLIFPAPGDFLDPGIEPMSPVSPALAGGFCSLKQSKPFRGCLFLILEKEMATHSSILAWRIPWTEELGGLQSTGRKESDTTPLSLHFTFSHTDPFNTWSPGLYIGYSYVFSIFPEQSLLEACPNWNLTVS